MMEFIREGGAGVWPILLFGLVHLGVGLRFAARPDASLRPVLGALEKLVWLSTAFGFVLALSAVCHYIAAREGETSAQIIHTFITGLGESIGVPVLGVGLLVVTALCVAVGERRLRAQLAS